MALAGSWSDVGGAHIQAFTFSSQDHGRLSAVLWCVVCCVCMRVLCCVVCCVGVGVWWWWCCVLCGCCVVVWCVFLCLFSLFSLSSLLSLSCSRSFFLFSSFLLLSLLLATAANFEAFECDLAHGKCTAVGSLPPPLSSPPPFSPSSPQKKEGTFHYRNISGEGLI